MIVGYVRTSVIPQEVTIQHNNIKDYATQKGYNIDIIYNGISIEEVCDNILSPKDILIVNDIACLGSSLFSVRNILAKISTKDITMISIREGYCYDKNSTYLLDGFDFALDMFVRLIWNVWDKLYARNFIEKNSISFPEGISTAEDRCFNLLCLPYLSNVICTDT